MAITAARFSRPARAARWLRRMAFLVHRWLGIALALLMAIWALSGFVMMYVSFPETTREERLAGLAPLDLAGCCGKAVIPDRSLTETAGVEMVAGKPVLRLSGLNGVALVSLDGSKPVEVGRREAGEIAATHLRRTFGISPAFWVEPIDHDQWTVYQRLRKLAPLFKVSFADEHGTVLYVSGLTGEVVQDTTARERFWNWLGAVPHWLYFTALRQNTPLWSKVVIYASTLGVFLTLTGIYAGLRMYGRGKSRSPFRGIALWHHWTGLIFGIATLIWVFSGLTSMTPWSWLESKGPSTEQNALAGRAIIPSDYAALVHSLAAHPQPGVVSAELIVQSGRPFAVLAQANGIRRRASLPELVPAQMSNIDLAGLAHMAKPTASIRSQGMIQTRDEYYYAHHGQILLPAWRVIYADKDSTRLYFDPRTGEMVGHVDPGSRAYRWWHSGLHQLDFAAISARPLWDAIVLTLLTGVSLLCLLGVAMGIRRLGWRSRISRRSA